MTNICPKGHFSTDQDYCSECGVAMQAPRPSTTPSGASGTPVNSATPTQGAENCPECMTPRPAGARFCEACRYDFVNRASFSSLAASTSVPADPIVTPSAEAASPDATQVLVSPRINAGPVAMPSSTVAAAQRLLLRIVVDQSLYTDPEPDSPCPTDRPEKVFHLDLDENTLGRQFEGKGVHPEIVVQDPSISRRHLKFVRGSGGQYSVLELGSANGSEFNGKALEPGVVTLLNPGDQITLGMWTRIHIEAR
jgi:hypothetical protein